MMVESLRAAAFFLCLSVLGILKNEWILFQGVACSVHIYHCEGFFPLLSQHQTPLIMKIKTAILAAVCVSFTSFTAPCVFAEAAKPPVKTEVPAKAYPLNTCIVADEPLDDKAVSFVYQGQEVKFCCKKCQAKFEKDPATYLKKLAGK